MSDYNMGGAQAGQSVDWYTPSTAGAYGNYGGAGYAAPQPAYGAPTYSSNAYDEEPPLLEGQTEET